VEEDVSPNNDFVPISYYYHLLYWASHFDLNLTAAILIFLALSIFYLTRLSPLSFSIFTTGFAGASLEIVLLIGFQIVYGYVYHMLGVVITAFMLGLALGAYYANKRLKGKKCLVGIEFSIGLFSIGIPFIFMLSFKNPLGCVVFPFLTLVLAVLVGMEFPIASKLEFKGIAQTAAGLYNADFIGACIGALIVSAFLIPLFGMVKVCFLIGVMNLLSGAIVLFKL
jgi:spermidine synthase